METRFFSEFRYSDIRDGRISFASIDFIYSFSEVVDVLRELSSGSVMSKSKGKKTNSASKNHIMVDETKEVLSGSLNRAGGSEWYIAFGTFAFFGFFLFT